MIKNIIKRDGRTEPYIPSKLNAWGKWAAKSLGGKVDWSSIVIQTVSSLPQDVTSSELQEKLIQCCLDKGTYSYYLMAGRLYAAHLHKTIHGKSIPTIKEVHHRLYVDGLMVKLDYSDLEYEIIEQYINHELDFETPHFSLHHIRKKYSLQNRTNSKEYETQQFVYMRMAMALSEEEQKETRLDLVRSFYKGFSSKKLSAPTPNYVNLGTKLKTYVSCNLYVTDDTIPSLAAGDHIAYMMTASSAGIGGNIITRSKGDPVRGGLIEHQGKLGYYSLLGKAVKANLQSGRGGACTTYYSGYDPEAEVISHLRNPRSTEDRKNRDLHYALMTNKFFATKVAKNEDAFSFNVFTAPDLNEAFYSHDTERFADLYRKYEQDAGFKKEYFKPRDLILTAMNEALETGVAYLAFIDEINRHTPFKEPIHSSNLCVAEDTIITTDKGDFKIIDKAGQVVNIWNGEEFTPAKVEKTGVSQDLLIIQTNTGGSVECTLYHKWYTIEKDESGNPYVRESRTYELSVGSIIEPYRLPNGELVSPIVTNILPGHRGVDTYCLNEPKRHRALFNGLLTGQCLEITEPTTPYQSTKDLYADREIGYVKAELIDGTIIHCGYSDRITLIDGTILFAGELTPGMVMSAGEHTTRPLTISKILEVVKEPEVALCSLGGIAIENIQSEEEYQELMYLSLKMVDYCILNSEYVLPHIGVTAKKRMNAAVGIMGVAIHMAKKKLTYDSPEGLEELHWIAERHMYHAIKASLRIVDERGTAPWIHKTKWVDGWIPLDTYNRKVDELGNFKNRYDWEELRKDIKRHGGIGHSVLVAYMPVESSSKAIQTTNSLYPIRDLTLLKTDNSTTIRWAAPHGDNPDYEYQLAWDISELDMIKCYAVFQKWTDQSISADLWRKIGEAEKITSKDLLQQYFTMVKYGMKTRYYYNSNTSSNRSLSGNDSISNSTDCESCSL